MLDLWKIAHQDMSACQEFTTFKYRESVGYQKRTIDYVFLAKNEALEQKDGRVQNFAVTEFFDAEDIEDAGLLNNEIGNPTKDHPSDHYSLAYRV